MTNRIVHLSTVHPPFDTRIYHKECISLAKAGFDVSLIVTDHPDLKGYKNNKVKLISLKKPKNRYIRGFKTSVSAYKTAKSLNADIYHFHDPELIFVGLLLKNKDNVVIYDVHEDYETSIKQKSYIPKTFRTVLAKCFRWLEKNFTKRFEICLAEKYYAEKFPQGVAILNYPILKQDQNKQAKKSHDGIDKLIYTGNVTIDRGSEIHARLPLIDKNISVSFIGKCSSQLAEKINHIAKGGKERITFDGINQYVPREKIDSYYAQHNWFAGLALFPLTEHYAKKELTKFFEYMNASIPIICSDFPVWKRFVEKHKCGIAVNPYDDNEIIKAINYLRENPSVRYEMGMNGQVAVEAELNWNNEEKKLVNWYHQLINVEKLN